MHLIEFDRTDFSNPDAHLYRILSARLGDGYTVDVGSTRVVHLGRGGGSGGGRAIATVRTNPLFRVNVQPVARDEKVYVRLKPDVESDFLHYLVFVPTFSLGYPVLLLVAWLLTIPLQRRIRKALTPAEADQAVREQFHPLTWPAGGPPRTYTGREARKRASPIVAVAIDLARLLGGLGMVLAILLTSPETMRVFQLRLFGEVEFLITCAIFGLGGWLIATAVAILMNRPLALWKQAAALAGSTALYVVLIVVGQFFSWG